MSQAISFAYKHKEISMAYKPDDIFAVSNPTNTKQQSVLIITADDVQDVEFFYPYYRFSEEGYQVDVATPDGGEFKGQKGMGLKETKKISEINEEDYQLLYIPGGKAPAELKKNDDALDLTREFAESGKPIAAFCHGPQVLAAAGVIDGRNIAAWPEVKEEVEDAGANYRNEATVVDGQFITARWPGDLPSHLAATLEILQKSKAKNLKRAS
jgi:protease I